MKLTIFRSFGKAREFEGVSEVEFNAYERAVRFMSSDGQRVDYNNVQDIRVEQETADDENEDA